MLRADGTVLVEYIIFPQHARLTKDGAFIVQMTAVEVWLWSPATGLPSMRIAFGGEQYPQLLEAVFAPAGHRLAVIALSSAQILCLP